MISFFNSLAERIHDVDYSIRGLYRVYYIWGYIGFYIRGYIGFTIYGDYIGFIIWHLDHMFKLPCPSPAYLLSLSVNHSPSGKRQILWQH